MYGVAAITLQLLVYGTLTVYMQRYFRVPALQAWQRYMLARSELQFYRGLVRRYPEAKLYLVGGVVRDLLIGRPLKDLDFVVTGLPQYRLTSLLKNFGRVDLVGRTFGVIKFTPKGKHGSEAIDIALPRLDEVGQGSGAYRDVRVRRRANLPIEADLVRRDFTVNALAWDIAARQLIDTGFGLADLKARRLRTVGNPIMRFHEDFSRMLRGLRFSSELCFDFEPRTWQALKVNVHHLNDVTNEGTYVVPREVVAKELLKALYADALKAVALYDRSGAFQVLMPEVLAMKKCPQPKPYHMEGSVWQHSLLALKALNSKAFRTRYPERPDAELVLAVFLHDLGKPYTLKTPQRHGVDRIRFDGHDVVGGTMAKAIAERLKLASLPTDGPLHVNPEHLVWLLHHHLLLLHDTVRRMKLTTIEKYFVRHPLATKLQQLILVDSLATIPRSGRPVLRHLYDLRRILKRLAGRRRHLPAPLLSGDEIMGVLGIISGPSVGILLRRLREEQLLGAVRTKAQARAYIRRTYGAGI